MNASHRRAGALPLAALPLATLPLATLVLSGLAAGNAQAHAIVMDSTPKVRDHLPAGAETYTLHFNSRIDLRRSKLTVIAADRSEIPVTLAAGPDEQTMVGHATVATPGGYRLRWQVLAVDGHTTRGDIPFTADAPSPKP